MTFIKVCGITRYEDAADAAALGADALGFNFYPKSPRYIAPARAAEIAADFTGRLRIVGVFVDASAADIRAIAEQVQLDTVQFHGNEPPSALLGWSPRRVWRAVRLAPEARDEELALLRETVERVLFDAFDPVAFGGTGKEIPEERLRAEPLASLLGEAILSGGLSPENVAAKVARFRPFGVDVASGVESAPGVKDREKVQAFISAARA